MTARDTFAFFPEDLGNGSMEVRSGEHGVTFEVEEDVAVDGGPVICCALLPRAEAERLRDWLMVVLA